MDTRMDPYPGRIAGVKKELERRDLHAAILTSWESLEYLAGIKPLQSRARSFDPMPLIIPRESHEPVFVPTAAFGMAATLEHQNIKDIRPYDAGDIASILADTLTEWGLMIGPIGIESAYFSYRHVKGLLEKMPELRVQDVTDLVEGLRMIKSEEELDQIRKGAKITDRVLEAAAKDFLKPGVTELQVAGEIIRSAIEYGAEGESFHPQIFSGRRGYLLNISASNKTLEQGEVVMLDFGVNVNGYRTDTTRCFVLGRALEKHKNAAKLALAITHGAMDKIRPGVSASDIHKTVLSLFRKFGYEGYCRHYSGHGLGLSTWERPVLREYDYTVIQPKMALAVEQGLYFPDFGVRFEENIIVTKEKNENLFGYPTELIELGVH
jgi:Xaa-Pro aminopeptidase